MTISDTLLFLSQRIDYERMRMPYDPARIGLARMHELLERLGRPERKYPIVHVAGTKGKGSTAATIAGVLSAAGFKTGLYTSPHLQRVEERMAIDGRPCGEDDFVALIDTIRPIVAQMDREAPAGEPATGPTWFEIITAAAMLHFARQECQAAVLEVGLGGRLDATNVCSPQVAAITSISFDHTEQLGDTLELIAREKAGIIKPGVSTVSGVAGDEAAAAIQAVCRERGAPLIELGRDFRFNYFPPRNLETAPQAAAINFQSDVAGDKALNRRWDLRLVGRHQAANAATALAVVGRLRALGWSIPTEAVQSGLRAVQWPARVEVVSRHPAVVIDGAHNAASMQALVETLGESFSVARRHLVFAAGRDKDVAGMLGDLLDRFDSVCFTRFTNNPRSMPPEELQALAVNLRGRTYPTAETPLAAFQMMRALATKDDLICIAGSLFLAAELRAVLALSSSDMQE